MKQSTREWIRKAESDYLLALSLTQRRKVPVRDHACFHFQQSAEKYLKAGLEEGGIRFPRIHDLAELIRLAMPLHPLWSALVPAARRLNDYAVKVRYPGTDATPAEMKAAARAAKSIRAEVRLALSL